jgi:ABC-type amino acid transport substrate-binding protein
MKTILKYSACIVALIVAYYAFLKKEINTTQTDTIIVGTAGGYAPFVSLNNNGNYEGFDIDIAQSLASTLGKKLIIKDLGAMGPLFLALEQGSIDCIIWGLSVTQSRLEKVAMVPYQGDKTTAYSLLFWETFPSITSLANMGYKTICVEPGSSQEAVINKYPTIIKQTVPAIASDGVLQIQYGKADALFVEPAIAKKISAKLSQIRSVEIPLDPEDYVLGIGIAIKKENTDLIQKLTQAVEQIQQAGLISDYEKKWGIS